MHKERTKDQIEKLGQQKVIITEMTMKDALESSTKEAIYALDYANPLKLYDCLVPEIEAHRQLG